MGASAVEITLASGANYSFAGEPIAVRGAGVSVSIGTSGVAPAILHAEELSRHFIVSDGAMLTLRNLVNDHVKELATALRGNSVLEFLKMEYGLAAEPGRRKATEVERTKLIQAMFW